MTSTELIDQLNFCVIDLETTGGNPESEKIIEIGLVKIQGRKIISEKNYLINPQKSIPDFVQKLTGITTAKVKKSPLIEDVIDEVIEMIGDSILVAHNTSFDIPFLNQTLIQLNRLPLKNKVLCTNVMTKYLIPDIISSNLNFMSELFEIDHQEAHRASDDAKATAFLLIKYLNIFIKKEIKKVNQLYYPRNKFELDRLHFTIQEKPLLIDKISSIEIPSILTLKGESGILTGVFPISGQKNNKSLLAEFINTIEWKQATLKMQAPFLYSLISAADQYPKIPTQYRNTIAQYLQTFDQVSDLAIFQKKDFIIAPHLVSGQFINFNIQNLHASHSLVFKFPGHKKKLHNYLVNQTKRMKQNSKKNIQFPSEIDSLVQKIIAHEINNNESYLLLNQKDIIDEKNYTTLLEMFVRSHQDSYHFPRFHF